MKRSITVVSAVVVALFLASSAYSSELPAGGAGAIAGLMQGGYDDYGLSSNGNVILFADLDAYIFQNSGRGMGHEAAVAEDPTHGSGGGCAGDGPGGFCLQVLDSMGQLVCWADRPVSPGWMRDPSLACPLPVSAAPSMYTLRVSLRGEGESPCSDTVNYPSPKNPDKRHPYLLNISIKNVAPTGSLMRALGISNGER